MLNILKAAILGIVEGVTEFLPISSTGHLIIVNQWISFSENFTKMFDIVIQFGAILAVAVFFRHTLFPRTKCKEKREEAISVWQKVFVGVIPALFFGVIFGDFIEENLFNPIVVSLALLFGGICLIFLEKMNKSNKISSIKDLNFGTAFFIGIVQCFAMVPGISRSAATMIGAMFLGASRVVAVEFSFFLAIPTMAAASGYALLKNGLVMNSYEFGLLVVGFSISFLAAWGVIAVFMKYIEKKSLEVFGYYRIALGLFVLIYFWTK